jgi:hypothetical protein
MKNYIIEWFPERVIGNLNLTVDKKRIKYYFIGIFLLLVSLSISIFNIYTSPVVNTLFIINIIINPIALIFNLFLIVRVKKNKLKNGIPQKW